MRPLTLRVMQALIVAGAVAFLLWIILVRADERQTAVVRTPIELVPFQPGGPVGIALLERRGSRLTGTQVVWGLAPGTRHAVVLRERAARCAEGQVVEALPPIVADESGVAFGRLEVAAPTAAFRPGGLAVSVHAREDRRSSAVACGTADGRARLTPAQLTAAGGSRADVSALVQLERGRPLGFEPGTVQVIRARRGDAVALALRADEPDELRLAGYGLRAQVGPGTIARLVFRADRAGSFALEGRTTDGPVARVVVSQP